MKVEDQLLIIENESIEIGDDHVILNGRDKFYIETIDSPIKVDFELDTEFRDFLMIKLIKAGFFIGEDIECSVVDSALVFEDERITKYFNLELVDPESLDLLEFIPSGKVRLINKNFKYFIELIEEPSFLDKKRLKKTIINTSAAIAIFFGSTLSLSAGEADNYLNKVGENLNINESQSQEMKIESLKKSGIKALDQLYVQNLQIKKDIENLDDKLKELIKSKKEVIASKLSLEDKEDALEQIEDSQNQLEKEKKQEKQSEYSMEMKTKLLKGKLEMQFKSPLAEMQMKYSAFGNNLNVHVDYKTVNIKELGVKLGATSDFNSNSYELVNKITAQIANTNTTIAAVSRTNFNSGYTEKMVTVGFTYSW